MQITVVFACLVISAASAAQSDSTVACYMDASLQHMFFPLDPFLCTHIIYSTAYIDDDFSLKTLSPDVDAFSSMLKMLKDGNPTLKMLLGVGVKQSRLEVLTKQQITLDNFINSTLKYLMKNNYDGVELTWLEQDTDETLRNTETLTSFIKELRGWIDHTANKSLLVAVSLLEHCDNISTCIDKKSLSQYVDFICLLSLIPNNEGPQIDSTVSYWQDQVNLKKLILVLPALLQPFRKRQSCSQSRIVGINPERKVEQMNAPGMIIAKQVCQAIKSGQKEFKTLTILERAQSHGEDVSRVLQKGLGGVGVVMLDIGNFFNSVCLNCTENEKAILELNVITRHHHRHGHHGHSHHRHGQHGHRHHGHGQHGHRHHGHGHHGHRHRHHHHENHHHRCGHHGLGHHSNSHHVNSHHG
ncbi:histidine-rich carboxyl terminus protein 1 [Ictalurus furcatus]|uniref:histidine-rich carboxyl terminus protein 1 n=1 Tax=Ictalurus furcatus TaxID=66913 RepID=UPI002350147D|nr:histidine-rich carboxyl terminus protein 1 [Ictalurus furcatus]